MRTKLAEPFNKDRSKTNRPVAIPESRHDRSPGGWAWLVLGLGLVITAVLWAEKKADVEQNGRDYFEFRTEEFTQRIQHRIELYQQVLLDLRGLFEVAQPVTRRQFARYVSNIDLEQKYPGILGVGYAALIPAGSLVRHEASIRGEGFPSYHVVPEGRRDPYTSIVFIEPFNVRNQRAFGFDMFTEPVRRRAMELARDTDIPFASGKVRLLQENGQAEQAGFLIYVPVYRPGQPIETTQDKRAALQGWVYAPFRADDFVRGWIDGRDNELSVRFYDGIFPRDDRLLSDINANPRFDSKFRRLRVIEIAGQPWTLSMASRPALESRFTNQGPIAIAVGGAAMSLLLALITRLVLTGRDRALRLAVRLNREVLDSRKSLQEEKEILARILRMASPLILVVDEGGQISEFNQAAQTFTGYGFDEVSATPFFWKRFFEPERRWAVEDLLRQAFKGELPKDHEERWVSRSGENRLFSWSFSVLAGTIGTMRHLIAVGHDITERRQAEQALQKSVEQYQQLIHSLPNGVLVHDGQKVVFVNQAALTLFRTTPERLMGYNPIDLVDPTYQSVVRERMHRAIDEHTESVPIHEILLRPDGSSFHADVKSIPVTFGGRAASLVVFTDISRRYEMEEEIRLAASVYRTSSEGMLITDGEARIVAVNPAFTALTGYTLDEVAGKTPQVLQSGLQSEGFYRDLWARLKTSGYWQGDLWNRRKDGSIYAEHLTINAERGEDGQVHHYVGLFSDVTEKKEQEQLVWNFANYDTLTKLPNRRLFYDRLGFELKKSDRTHSSLALLFIDLDHFKEINDTLGHGKGDLLLVESARRILQCIRETDTLARLGGDEFTIILPTFSERSNLERILQTILNVLRMPFDLGDGQEGHVSASIGVTIYPEDASTLEQLLQHADQAMYSVKAAGRDGFGYFKPAMQQEAQQRMALANDLRRALEQDQFRLYFQPILDVVTGQVVKAEALLRWQHPQRGLLEPFEFLPVAEEMGLMKAIGEWVAQRAMNWMKHWKDRHGAGIQVTINRAESEFVSQGAYPWLEKLAQAGLSPRDLAFDVAEKMLTGQNEVVKAELDALRSAGVDVVVDDFGKGFTALAYVNRDQVNYLKIDRSFVAEMETNPTINALVEITVMIARRLGIETIAEGVETESQRDRLRSFGCRLMQGHLYAPALSPEEFENHLSSNS